MNSFIEFVREQLGQVFEIVDGLIDERDRIGQHGGNPGEKRRAVFIYSSDIPAQVLALNPLIDDEKGLENPPNLFVGCAACYWSRKLTGTRNLPVLQSV